MSSNPGNGAEMDLLLEHYLEEVRREGTYLNYWNTYKRIQRLDLSGFKLTEKMGVKIGILSSFTVDPLVVYLDIECRLIGLYPKIYTAPFNQYPQEILNEGSFLYSFNPDVIIVAVQAESLLGDDFFPSFTTLSDGEKEKLQSEVFEHLGRLISKLADRTKALILVNNFVVPWFSPLGILDNKVRLGLSRFFEGLNQILIDSYEKSRQVYVVDIERLASTHGKARCINYEMYYRGAIALSESFLPLITEEYMSYIKALRNLTRKCIVLDLDNVLWGGVIGEDGFDGIKLGGEPMGRAYADFQRLLLSYYNRGIILALNSKNNKEEALRVIQEHPSMILRERHFASMRINWKDKVENMIDLSNELNLGLESMVFVDDSPQERERIRQALPQVLVLDLPVSPFRHREALYNVKDFNSLILSEEDKRRGDMYYAKRKRRDLLKSKGNMEDFLRSLDIRAEIKYADSFTIPRITSLINRTNQFNVTTRRYNLAEIEEMCSKPDEFKIYHMRIRDRFGDEGIVGVAIIQKKGRKWVIDSFLLSCRVIGRKVETALLAKIVEDARREEVSFLIGEFIPTKKNTPAKSLYNDHGFEMIKEEDATVLWKLNPNEVTVKTPDWVKNADE